MLLDLLGSLAAGWGDLVVDFDLGLMVFVAKSSCFLLGIVCSSLAGALGLISISSSGSYSSIMQGPLNRPSNTIFRVRTCIVQMTLLL